MRNAGLKEAQAGIKITRRNINNLRYADDTTLMAESKEELTNLLKGESTDSTNIPLLYQTHPSSILETVGQGRKDTGGRI